MRVLGQSFVIIKFTRVFQIVVRGGTGGIRSFAGKIFLPGGENHGRNDFDDSNLFQS